MASNAQKKRDGMSKKTKKKEKENGAKKWQEKGEEFTEEVKEERRQPLNVAKRRFVRGMLKIGKWERKKLEGVGRSLKERVKEDVELARATRAAEHEAYKTEAVKQAKKRGVERAKKGRGGGFLSGLADYGQQLSKANTVGLGTKLQSPSDPYGLKKAGTGTVTAGAFLTSGRVGQPRSAARAILGDSPLFTPRPPKKSRKKSRRKRPTLSFQKR